MAERQFEKDYGIEMLGYIAERLIYRWRINIENVS